MTVINLRRYYYPLVKTDTFMEVPEEVAEALLQLHREENNRINKRIYHKAYFSLDCDDGIENDAIGWEQPSPEELVIQAEEEAVHELLFEQPHIVRTVQKRPLEGKSKDYGERRRARGASPVFNWMRSWL